MSECGNPVGFPDYADPLPCTRQWQHLGAHAAVFSMAGSGLGFCLMANKLTLGQRDELARALDLGCEDDLCADCKKPVTSSHNRVAEADTERVFHVTCWMTSPASKAQKS